MACRQCERKKTETTTFSSDIQFRFGWYAVWN